MNKRYEALEALANDCDGLALEISIHPLTESAYKLMARSIRAILRAPSEPVEASFTQARPDLSDRNVTLGTPAEPAATHTMDKYGAVNAIPPAEPRGELLQKVCVILDDMVIDYQEVDGERESLGHYADSIIALLPASDEAGKLRKALDEIAFKSGPYTYYTEGCTCGWCESVTIARAALRAPEGEKPC